MGFRGLGFRVLSWCPVVFVRVFIEASSVRLTNGLLSRRLRTRILKFAEDAVSGQLGFRFLVWCLEFRVWGFGACIFASALLGASALSISRNVLDQSDRHGNTGVLKSLDPKPLTLKPKPRNPFRVSIALPK